MAEPASVTFWRCGSWWRRDTRPRGPETQVLRAKCSNTRVVKTRLQQQKRAVSVYRGPETQVLRAKCSNTRHGRIVSDRHGYPLVLDKVLTNFLPNSKTSWALFFSLLLHWCKGERMWVLSLNTCTHPPPSPMANKNRSHPQKGDSKDELTSS
jgi:hypothetical protein